MGSETFGSDGRHWRDSGAFGSTANLVLAHHVDQFGRLALYVRLRFGVMEGRAARSAARHFAIRSPVASIIISFLSPASLEKSPRTTARWP